MIKQRFCQNTTGQVEPIQATGFQEYALIKTVNQ